MSQWRTLADSYVSATARSGGAAAEQASVRKSAKYDLLVQTGHLLQPIVAESLASWIIHLSLSFWSWVAWLHLFQETTESPAFFFQRMSITTQRFNSILLHNSFSSNEEWPLQLFFLLLTLFLTLGSLHLRVKNNNNDIIWRVLKRAQIPAVKEPVSLVRDDKKDQMGPHCCHRLEVSPWPGT